MLRAELHLFTAGIGPLKLETADTRPPVKAAVGAVVFGGEPEGSVVDRINGHIAVVAPPVNGIALAAGAINNVHFIPAHEIARMSG